MRMSEIIQPRIAIVGEAWGEHEAILEKPFVGEAGKELTRMLEEAGINRSECLLTNVFNFRPAQNNILEVCGKPGIEGFPPLQKGKTVRAEFQPELDRLRAELASFNPTLVIALGNTAAWALLKQTAITKIRGTTALSHWGYKVLPTFHPAAILRQWENRIVTVADLIKAKREATTPDLIRPRRQIWTRPTYEDLLEFEQLFMTSARFLSVDVETCFNRFIDTIGIAPSESVAISIAFFNKLNTKEHFYEETEEKLIWRWLKKHLEGPVPKIGQNGLYDIQYLLRAGIRVRPYLHDTMLLAHCLQPELPKSLGFLGSIHTDEASWKLMRNDDSGKAEE